MNKKSETSSGLLNEMKTMIAGSVGLIPAALVILFAIAATIAALAGLFLKFESEDRSRRQVFMPLRIESEELAAPIDIKKMQGQWIYQTSSYAMSMTFIGDRFEWIVKLSSIQEAQFYARGNFRVDGDVLVLGQRPDLGKPYDPAQPWLKFLPIAMKDLNVRLNLDKNKMGWEVPESEQKEILSHVAQIFEENDQGKFEWVKR